MFGATATPAEVPAPSPVAVVFYLCDLVTGQIQAELPLEAQRVRRVIAREESQTFALPTADDACPDDWADLLVPGRSMIVQTLDDQPVQAWVVLDDERGGPVVTIQGSTLEHCLSRTYVPDVDFTGDEAEGAMIVLAPLVPRFGFTLEHTNTGKVSEFFYSTLEDRTLLAVLNDLMAAEDGPEWRVFVRWTDEATKQAFTKVVRVEARVGIDRPDAIFDLDADGRGCVESYRRRRSYTSGKGATLLIGTSEGSGASRPMTDPLYSPLVDAGWPVWEDRVNFSGLGVGSVGDEDAELLRRTQQTLTQRQAGTTVWQVVGNENAPRPGRDFTEGDTVHIDIAPQGKTDPHGGQVAVRVLGWEMSLASGQVTPILWEDPDA